MALARPRARPRSGVVRRRRAPSATPPGRIGPFRAAVAAWNEVRLTSPRR
jgi:hypothetical protein